jgi:hypothetical protein
MLMVPALLLENSLRGRDVKLQALS